MTVQIDAFSQPPRGGRWRWSLPLSPSLENSSPGAALYLLSSGLMACGLMGPVRMGLVAEMGGFSGSGRSFTTT